MSQQFGDISRYRGPSQTHPVLRPSLPPPPQLRGYNTQAATPSLYQQYQSNELPPDTYYRYQTLSPPPLNFRVQQTPMYRVPVCMLSIRLFVRVVCMTE